MSINRIYINQKSLIEYLFVHHTAGRLYKNRNKEWLKNKYSDIGFDRGYERFEWNKKTGECWRWKCSICGKYNNKSWKICRNKTKDGIKCNHKRDDEKLVLWAVCKLRDPDNGKIVYPMYHYLVQPYDKDGNIFGYRVIPLIADPLNYDCGSTGKAFYNQKAIAVSFCGNYTKKMIDPRAIQVAAKELKYLWEYTKGRLKILGHKEVDNTKCPGKIQEQLHAFKYMIGGGDIPSPRIPYIKT